VRLSRATEESTSVARQEQIIRQHATARGWHLVGIESDPDVSASKSRLDRPGLNAARQAIAAGRAEAILVWRLDRIARSVVDFGTLLDEGLSIVSATEPIDSTSSAGRAMAEILQVFAGMEARTIGERVSSSRRYLPTVGRFPGGVVPYGYRAVPHPSGEGRALDPDPSEALVVRRMVTAILGGATVTAVTAALNADGVPPRRPERSLPDGSVVKRGWSPTTVQRIVRSDAILGRVRAGGVYRKVGRRTVTVRSAEPLRGPDGLPIVFWEPLATVEELERLRSLTEWTPTPGRSEATSEGLRTRSPRLLAGLLTCPNCGFPLLSKKRGAKNDVYVCGSAQRSRICPKGVVVECFRADEEVTRHFLAAYGHLKVVESRIEEREVRGVAGVEEAIRDTTDALRDPAADLSALFERLTTLRAERERLGSLQADPPVTLIETGETIAEAWAKNDDVWRRRLIAASGVEIRLHPAKQRGKWDPDRVEVVMPTDYLTPTDYLD
jgi:DNA invertase Pin-like site-specific DNA recombinase